MPNSTFVFLDTNIFFRVITQGQDGCELEHLAELKRYIDDGTVCLLVPELVRLELEKQYRLFENAVGVNVAKIKKHLSDPPGKEKIWNEIGDILPYLEDQLVDWEREKIAKAKERHDEIQRLISSERVTVIPLDSEIWLRAKQRIWAGRVANIDNRSEADCCILESLAKFFEGRGPDGQLLFCTENTKDFCLSLDEEKLVIHPLMEGGLPPTRVFKDLASLVCFVRDHEVVEKPAPEDVSQALEREKTRQIEEGATGVLPDDISRLGAMLAAAEYHRTLTPDLSAYRAMQDAVKAATPELSAYRAMQDAVKTAMPDLSMYRAVQDAVKAATPHLSAIRAMQDMVKTATPNLSALRAVQDALKAVAPDLSALREVVQESPKPKPADDPDTRGAGDADTDSAPPKDQNAPHGDNEENPGQDRNLGADGDVSNDG